MSQALQQYVEIWWQAVNDLTGFLEGLEPGQWHAETDLPGWDVHAVAAHAAHLEALLAGTPHEDIDVTAAEHVRNTLGSFNEQGVTARRDHSPDALINEIRESATTRHTELLANPPLDGTAPAPGLFGAIGWTHETLLRNRPLDLWMHEQDIRRAVHAPGNLDSDSARHAVDYLSEGIPKVLAKGAGADPGSTLVLAVNGSPTRAFEVGGDGRGRTVDELPTDPTASLSMDTETFILLAGGRRAVPEDAVRVEGDAGVARRVIAQLGVTP